MYNVYGAPITTGAQETGVLTDGLSQRRAVQSTGPDDVLACRSARIGVRTQRPPARGKAGCTWERGDPTGWERVFVGILRIRPHRQNWSPRSHVHRPPYVHMGAVNQPRRISENRGIMRKIDIHPGRVLLSHVQPLRAAPSRQEGTAEAPAQGRRISQASLTLATAIPWRGAAS